jgi:small subunit ribosomal protein S16
MLTIRFNRIGKKNKAYFRLVVQEHTIAPGGGHVEILGSYDPHLKKDSLKPERIKYWVEKGVKFSDTAFNFLVSKGLIAGPKRTVKFPKKPEAPLAEVKTEAKTEIVETPTEKKPEEPKTEEPKEEIKKEEEKSEVKEVKTTEEVKPEVAEKK